MALAFLLDSRLHWRCLTMLERSEAVDNDGVSRVSHDLGQIGADQVTVLKKRAPTVRLPGLSGDQPKIGLPRKQGQVANAVCSVLAAPSSLCELRHKGLGRAPGMLHSMVPQGNWPFATKAWSGSHGQHIFMALMVPITCFLTVMLWAQAGRFEARESVQTQADSSFKPPYRTMPLNPIN